MSTTAIKSHIQKSLRKCLGWTRIFWEITLIIVNRTLIISQLTDSQTKRQARSKSTLLLLSIISMSIRQWQTVKASIMLEKIGLICFSRINTLNSGNFQLGRCTLEILLWEASRICLRVSRKTGVSNIMDRHH